MIFVAFLREELGLSFSHQMCADAFLQTHKKHNTKSQVIGRDHVFLVRPFRRHLFRCRSFSAQIISSPIRCSLTVQLVRVRIRARVWVRQKALNWCRKGLRAEKSWTLIGNKYLNRYHRRNHETNFDQRISVFRRHTLTHFRIFYCLLQIANFSGRR